MASRSGSNSQRAYSAENDLAYQEMSLLSMLYILGYDSADTSVRTIDDVIESIRETFNYKRNSEPTAANSFVRSINILMVLNYRRAWFDRQIALGVIENG
jgi:hypothetical protein